MKKWVQASALLMLGAIFSVGVSGANEAKEHRSTVLEISVQVSGEPVIESALVEVLNGTPARISAFDDESRTSGLEVHLNAGDLPVPVEGGGVLVGAEIWQIKDGQRISLADAEIGAASGKPASLQLESETTPILMEVKVHGQKTWSEEDLVRTGADQCAEGTNNAQASDIASSCCTRKCGDGSDSWMECCGAIYCCICGVCCVTP